jgi:hypothetical protein
MFEFFLIIKNIFKKKNFSAGMWYIPIIPATHEVEIWGGSSFEANLGKS